MWVNPEAVTATPRIDVVAVSVMTRAKTDDGDHVPPCPFVEPATARPELFVFAMDASAYHSWDWTRVTTVALFGDDTNNMRPTVAAPTGLLCKAHAHGARVVYGAGLMAPQVANSTYRSSWVAAQAESLSPTGTFSGYDGINVDFEDYIGAWDSRTRDALTALIHELRAALPGKQITVDIPAFLDEYEHFYDYKGLSQAADFLVMMDYDGNVVPLGGWPTPLASMANMALPMMIGGMKSYSAAGVAPQKLVAAVPFYGYRYTCDVVQHPPAAHRQPSCALSANGSTWLCSAGECHYTVSNINLTRYPTYVQAGYDDILPLLAASTGRQWDPVSSTPWFNVRNGSQLWSVWFEDNQSLALKASAVRAQGLRGIGMWLGDEAKIGEGLWEALLPPKEPGLLLASPPPVGASPQADLTRPPACYPGDTACCWPGVCPGWQWRSHGGLPLLPWPTDWSVNGSIASFFVGNASGFNSEKETAAGGKLGIYGIGWELENIPTHNTNLEPAEIEAARALKARNPATRVGVTRNSVVATTFWNTARAAMEKPPSKYFWLQCGAGPCTAKWGLDEPQPAIDPTSYMFNFSDATLADWYVFDYIGEAANQTLYDIVYFDAGVNVSVAPGLQTKVSLKRYIHDSQMVLDRAIRLIDNMSWSGSAAQLPPTYMSTPEQPGDTCGVMEQWMAAGRLEGHTFSPFSMAFSKFYRYPSSAGHHNWPHGPPTTRDQNATVAAFMVARGPSAILQLHMHGAYTEAVDFNFPPILFTDYGVPLGNATIQGTIYTRRYARGTVSLDCAAWSSTFVPLKTTDDVPITACPPPPRGYVPPYPYPNHTNPAWPDGGFPAMPWAPDWTLQGSTFANFLGNATGPMNSALLHNVSSLGIAGLGWNSFFQRPTDAASFTNPALLGHLEQLQGAEAAALKELRPAQIVMVSADIDATAVSFLAIFLASFRTCRGPHSKRSHPG